MELGLRLSAVARDESAGLWLVLRGVAHVPLVRVAVIHPFEASHLAVHCGGLLPFD